jgi:hypothetical protein
MDAVQIHTQAENGRVSFDLPAEYSALANARLLLVVMPEPKTPAEVVAIQHEAERLAKHAKLIAAFDELRQVSTFREISDPVQWQRELRSEGEPLSPAQS